MNGPTRETPIWVIWFYDQDHQHEVFLDAEPAERRFEQARTSWTCQLLISKAKFEQAIASAEEAMLREVVQQLRPVVSMEDFQKWADTKVTGALARHDALTEEATVLSCAKVIEAKKRGSQSLDPESVTASINVVLQEAATEIRALLKTPGQLARYVEQAAKPLVEAAEEATVLACMEHLRCKCSPLCDANHPVNHRTTLTTLLKTPGQLARYVEQAAKPLIVAAEEAVVQDYSKALANGPDAVKAWTDNFLKDRKDGISNLARREDEIRRQEAQWWDTYIDEHLEKYGKEWRRKRGKERLAELSQPSAPQTAASDATNE